MDTQTETNAPPATDATPMTALEQYGAYPFASDQEYQQGLASILLGQYINPEDDSPEAREEILRRTRVFYFNKVTGSSIAMDEARDYERAAKAERSPGLSSPSQPQLPEEPRVLSFSELKELIESGRIDQIPNNKIIPDKFCEEAPSQSTTAVRKKPWETALPEPQIA